MKTKKKTAVDARVLTRMVTRVKLGTLDCETAMRWLDKWYDEGRLTMKEFGMYRSTVAHVDAERKSKAVKAWFWCQMTPAQQDNFCVEMNTAMQNESDPPYTLDVAASAEWYDPTSPHYFFVLTIPEETERQYLRWLCAVPVFRNINLPKALKEHIRVPFERDLVPFCMPQDASISVT